MFVIKNNRASRLKLNNGVFLGRGESAVVSPSVIADRNLSRLVSRGKVSISTKYEDKEPLVKYGVVDKEQVKVPATVVQEEVPPVKTEAKVTETDEKVDEPTKKPTVKRRSRRKTTDS